MADLRYAFVLFKGRRAGILKEEPDGGTSFSYGEGGAETIACALPYQSGASFSWPGGLHPFFQHLTPEGWLRNTQARTADVETEDDFGILLAYGYDCIGAVSIQAPDSRWLNIDDDRLDALTRAAVKVKKTVSGIQPKLFVDEKDGRFFPAEETGLASWIAKFPADAGRVEHIILNEFLSLRAASVLLGAEEVTYFDRAVIEGVQEPALVVRRFDRTPDGGKLRLEDFAQILSIPRGRDFQGKYNGSFEQCAAVIKKYSVRAQIDLFQFFRRVVAFALLGNCDCHLKNWSLLETPQGLRLSPTYDVVNTYIYAAQGYSTEFGLDIGGRKREWESVDRAVLRQLGRDIGLTGAAVDSVFEEFTKKRDFVLHLIDPGDAQQAASAEFRKGYADAVRAAYERIGS
ncbi:MAG: HipA domain-containing protein [Rhodospirillales bacterium]|nr:HipA domain-containing protein [Rhodospirillales bacterium]MCB9995406.1 HipA domain-containing protein [Rhodospirillales bacterium]